MCTQVAERNRLARLSAAAHVNAHAELADLPLQTRASRTGNHLHYAHKLQLALRLQTANVKTLQNLAEGHVLDKRAMTDR